MRLLQWLLERQSNAPMVCASFLSFLARKSESKFSPAAVRSFQELRQSFPKVMTHAESTVISFRVTCLFCDTRSLRRTGPVPIFCWLTRPISLAATARHQASTFKLEVAFSASQLLHLPEHSFL